MFQLYEHDVDNFDSAHNVVIFGENGTGKTTIINHFFNNPDISELDRRCVSLMVMFKERDKMLLMLLPIYTVVYVHPIFGYIVVFNSSCINFDPNICS